MEQALPSTRFERAKMLKLTLISKATGGNAEENVYTQLRNEFMSDTLTNNLLPNFVRTSYSLSDFWSFIQPEAANYKERRAIINSSFKPLLEHLENTTQSPCDTIVSDALMRFDSEGVHVAWEKALARRMEDAEGAITMARTLLESVCKHILDESSIPYSDKEDLPKLYTLAANILNLAPSQHSEEPIKAILGGATNVVNGFGTLRNRLSDAHGRGSRLPVKPSPRHATLAVNMAGAIATFLIETFQEKIAVGDISMKV
jgi:Abortive infection C-terminus